MASAPPKKPCLSVIIPVRNHARVLKILLDNLKTQKVPDGWDVEILVSEGRSTDDTPDVANAAWRCSKWQAIIGFPFYALTVFSWTLAVIWGHEPTPEELQTI